MSKFGFLHTVQFLHDRFRSGIKLAAVDATQAQELADKYGVKGYPTLKYFPKGSIVAEDYEGGRTAETIVKYDAQLHCKTCSTPFHVVFVCCRWVNEKVGTNRKVKVPPSHVAALTTETFDSTVLGSKAALVEFYAPWYVYCFLCCCILFP